MNQNLFTVHGEVEKIFPEQSGQSSNGHWTRQDFLLKNEERNYVYRYNFTLFGKKIDSYAHLLQKGKELTVTFGVTTNVRDERAFTSLMVVEIVEYDAALEKAQEQVMQSNDDDDPFS